jgi:RimJ/RimL family protein N-acetyltransferase
MRTDTAFEPLVTERLQLRRSAPEDSGVISSYRSDPDVRRWQGWDRTDPESVRAVIEEMANRSPGEAGGWVQLSVIERETGSLVGDVGMSPADGEPGVMKIGYTVSPSYQGRGYATEAVGALVEYILGTLGADVVRAYASASNAPSIAVAEHVGMKLVERIRRGQHGDDVRYVVRYERRR